MSKFLKKYKIDYFFLVGGYKLLKCLIKEWKYLYVVRD